MFAQKQHIFFVRNRTEAGSLPGFRSFYFGLTTSRKYGILITGQKPKREPLSWGYLPDADGTYETLAQTNPFRYRGYYYDTETGLYYPNSRYYDASVCRFLSPDSAGILEALAAAFTMVPPPVAKGTANDTTSAASPAQAQGFAILVHNADYDAIAKLKSDENQQTIVKWAKEYKKQVLVWMMQRLW